jgi:hypothetical protein
VLACVLSASISVTGLYAVGIIERAKFSFTWWNWYVGDVLGVLVFAPLTLCLLNRPDGVWYERRRRIVVPMLLTLVLVVLAFYGTARWERKIQKDQLHSDSDIIAGRIADRLITHHEVLSSLRNFIEATPDLGFRQFEQFTRLTLEDKPDIFALSYNDLITDDRRLEYERAMSRLSPLGSVPDHGAQGRASDPRRPQTRVRDRPLHRAPGQQRTGSGLRHQFRSGSSRGHRPGQGSEKYGCYRSHSFGAGTEKAGRRSGALARFKRNNETPGRLCRGGGQGR